MDLHLGNKLALVTGSTQGIGKEVASRLLREGATVIINGRSQDRIDDLLPSMKLLTWLFFSVLRMLLLLMGLPSVSMVASFALFCKSNDIYSVLRFYLG